MGCMGGRSIMSEKSDYAILKRHLPNGYDRLERVENVCGSGNPDINFCSEGAECWIEMKSPKEPVRKTSKLFGDNHPLLQTQKNWFLRQKNANGRAYILIVTDKRWMLIDGCQYGRFIQAGIDKDADQRRREHTARTDGIAMVAGT